MGDKYILENGEPVLTLDTIKWGIWFDFASSERQLASTEKDGIQVSTVFLGMDHSPNPGGASVLWETMVFGGEHDGYQERYTSAEKAMLGHRTTCDMVWYPWKDTPAGVPCWHIHHDELLEWSDRPLKERADFILRTKPVMEHPTRLKLMRPVLGQLPEAVMKTGEYYWKVLAWLAASTYESEGAYNQRVHASWDWHGAVARHQAEINALHDKEHPDCPWDGNTIFPEERE